MSSHVHDLCVAGVDQLLPQPPGGLNCSSTPDQEGQEEEEQEDAAACAAGRQLFQSHHLCYSPLFPGMHVHTLSHTCCPQQGQPHQPGKAVVSLCGCPSDHTRSDTALLKPCCVINLCLPWASTSELAPCSAWVEQQVDEPTQQLASPCPQYHVAAITHCCDV